MILKVAFSIKAFNFRAARQKSLFAVGGAVYSTILSKKLIMTVKCCLKASQIRILPEIKYIKLSAFQAI